MEIVDETVGAVKPCEDCGGCGMDRYPDEDGQPLPCRVCDGRGYLGPAPGWWDELAEALNAYEVACQLPRSTAELASWLSQREMAAEAAKRTLKSLFTTAQLRSIADLTASMFPEVGETSVVDNDADCLAHGVSL